MHDDFIKLLTIHNYSIVYLNNMIISTGVILSDYYLHYVLYYILLHTIAMLCQTIGKYS